MNDLKEKLGARMRVLRAERGLNRKDLAQKLGLNLAEYDRIERGETDISLSKVGEIADAFEVPTEELLLPSGQNYSNSGTIQGTQGTYRNNIQFFHCSLSTELLERLQKLEKEFSEMAAGKKKTAGK